MYFEAPSAKLPPLETLRTRQWPISVAEIVNDGTGVFVVPDRLAHALAHAGPKDLDELTYRRPAGLRQVGGEST
ncbi:Uncharacterised protein [Nocardia otitidiscaviarum]|uniref:Uncharacterized protein n=1 Tax=Nocardia otitidiscaviarum TaxID=1823 RepID=A0A378YAQ7_9NOCA|nr:Uncharacterised protein [Nocardia otitidiscaviarum]